MVMRGSPRSLRLWSQMILALAAVAVLGLSAAQDQGDVCRAYPLVQIPPSVVANLLISKLLCWGRASHGGSLVVMVFVFSSSSVLLSSLELSDTQVYEP